ncbi:MAG: methionyl-tRNA formyltransferase, partial [bacterium]
FMGTAPFGFPVMRVLKEHESVEVAGVFTQPDRRRGRGQKNSTPPVGEFARELELPLYQPEDINEEGLCLLDELGKIDLGIVVAYGQFLDRELFTYPEYDTYNFHASLLPRWRGAAPIRHTLLAGDEETGVSVFKLEEGMDTGPVCQQVRTTVQPGETYGELYERLSRLNVGALELLLAELAEDTLDCEPQTGEPTYAPMIKSKDARLDFNQSAESVHRHICAFAPDPGAFTFLGEDRLKIYRSKIVAESGPPGEVLQCEDDFIVACAEKSLALLEVQLAGSRQMEISDFLAGRQDINKGMTLGE